MRKILIGTPTYDGTVDVDYMTSLFQTMELCMMNNIAMNLKTVVGCSIIGKARNRLFKIAYETGVDDLIFIDSDQSWTQKDFGNLISPTVDVIGGAVIGKNDLTYFNVKTFDGTFNYFHGLIDARGVGTGFFRMSRRAIEMMWDASEKYMEDGEEMRDVFKSGALNGEYVGEDIYFCDKWRELGEKVYVHPDISVAHIGKKKWMGNFDEYAKLRNEEKV